MIDIEVKILSDRKVEIPYRRFGGTQGDTGYRVKFDISDIYNEDNLYRVEWYGAADSFTQTIELEVSDGIIYADVPTELIKAGGTAVAYLVEEKVIDDEVTERICTYPIRLYFNNKPTGDNSVTVGEYERKVTDMYLAVVKAKLEIDEQAGEAQKSYNDAQDARDGAENFSYVAMSYAVGESGARPGIEETDNAKYYCEQARIFKENAESSATKAGTSETNALDSETKANDYANLAQEAKVSAESSANKAETFAKEIEGKNITAYEIAVENGFKGTEAEWLESLKGEDSAGSVKYTETQNLTEEEKNTARTNIFAMPYFEVTDDSPLEFVDITDENGNIVENAPRKLRIDMSGEITYDDKSSGMKLNKGVGLISDGNTVFVDTDAIATREYAELTAQSEVNKHNVSENSHNDIRLLVDELSSRIKALLDCDDKTLDQTSEIVTYIKSNKELIDSITTAKVNVADIIDNLITNVSDKPLSAKQGVVLKELIDAIVVPTKVSELTDDVGYAKSSDVEQSLASKADKENGYEVIQDTTLTEEIQAFEFTDLNLLKARIFLEIPTASANQSAQVRINGISVNASKNTRVAYLNNLIINTADNYSLIEIEKSNNIIEASWVINKKTTGFGTLTKGLSENYVRECENDENITSIYVVVSNSDVLFPIGTRIVVKGVKAE